MDEKSSRDGLRGLLKLGGVPDLGPGPRAGVMPKKELDTALAGLLPRTGVLARNQELSGAIALIWHDQLDAAHSVVQAIPDADGSYLHGIVHRREPDYSNAKYWFHRVGQHWAFPSITAEATIFLTRVNADSFGTQLNPGGKWNPFALIDLCAATRNANQAQWLREIQAIELRVLLKGILEA